LKLYKPKANFFDKQTKSFDFW